MKRRILMLDIDGVLNVFSRGTDNIRSPFEPDKLAILQQLLNTTGAEVVLCASMRKLFTPQETSAMFARAGLDIQVTDHTPSTFKLAGTVEMHGTLYDYSLRGHEIQAWLDAQPDKDNIAICILDDADDMLHLTPYLVQTDGWNHGLLPEHIAKVLEVFSRQ